MRKVMGIGCIALGILCLLGAAGFVVYNRFEAEAAEEASGVILQDVQVKIAQNVQEKTEEPQQEAPDETVPVELPLEMPVVEMDGYDCIGILSVPVLELELPVLTDWSYERLRKAPCHYYGSYYDTDFVIAAHNYPSHFGRLSGLQPGDLVLFTDAAGTAHGYEVVLLETLPATATEQMITSGFDLSLYTCTPGGASRVTVRCQKIDR